MRERTVFIPANLLEAFDRRISALGLPALERRAVTAFLLGGGGTAKQWATAANLRDAAACWPAHMASKPVRNVLTVLLELEVLGVVTDISPALEGYDVTLKKELAA